MIKHTSECEHIWKLIQTPILRISVAQARMLLMPSTILEHCLKKYCMSPEQCLLICFIAYYFF